MAWDATQPQGSTKIRNLGNVITPNWDAIETADSTFLPQGLNFADRDVIAPPISSDPTAIADVVIAYSKQNGAGKPQGYAIDPDNSISHLTGIKAWVRFVGNGALGAAVLNDNFFVSGVNKDNATTFTITFSNNLKNTDYGVIVTSSGDIAKVISGTIAVGSVQVTTSADPRVVTVMIIGN